MSGMSGSESLPSVSHVFKVDVDDSNAASSYHGLATSNVGRRAQKKRKLVSWVCDHFVIDQDSDRFACMVNNCRTTYSKLTLTSTLALHLSSKHKVKKEGSGAASGDPAQTSFSSDGAWVLKHSIVDDTRAEIFEATVTWVIDDK